MHIPTPRPPDTTPPTLSPLYAYLAARSHTPEDTKQGRPRPAEPTKAELLADLRRIISEAEALQRRFRERFNL